MPTKLDDPAALRGHIRLFCDDYAMTLDDDDIERWPDFFTEEPRYVVQSAENRVQNLPIGLMYCDSKGMLHDRVTAIRQTVMFEPRRLRHVLGPLRIDAAEGEVRSRMNFVVFESIAHEEPAIFAVGTYEDRFVWSDDRLLLKERICVCDNMRVRNSLIYPL